MGEEKAYEVVGYVWEVEEEADGVDEEDWTDFVGGEGGVEEVRCYYASVAVGLSGVSGDVVALGM